MKSVQTVLDLVESKKQLEKALDGLVMALGDEHNPFDAYSIMFATSTGKIEMSSSNEVMFQVNEAMTRYGIAEIREKLDHVNMLLQAADEVLAEKFDSIKLQGKVEEIE
jgi:hypothetical protein